MNSESVKPSKELMKDYVWLLWVIRPMQTGSNISVPNKEPFVSTWNLSALCAYPYHMRNVLRFDSYPSLLSGLRGS
jgi:hypothetical protein